MGLLCGPCEISIFKAAFLLENNNVPTYRRVLLLYHVPAREGWKDK
jgi:hypothetical protein